MPTSENLPKATLTPAPKGRGLLYDPKKIRADVESSKIISLYTSHIVQTRDLLTKMKKEKAAAMRLATALDRKILQAYQKLGKLDAYRSLMRAQLFNQYMHRALADARQKLLDENRQG